VIAGPRLRLVRPSHITKVAMAASFATITWSATFLLVLYPRLPWLLAVHFKPNGFPNGWQYKTYWRVLMPVFVQLSLTLVLLAIGALLLSRPHGDHDENAPDVLAASAAAEAVALFAFIWVAFQGYVAVALTLMWRAERAGLGPLYVYLELTGIVLTIAVAIRAQARVGRPDPRPFVPEHWTFGHLYKNREDPALFVPTRNGSRWTLNFGRPLAAALMGTILVLGIVLPVVIVGLLLR
jgi:uncharacterized membrane protein